MLNHDVSHLHIKSVIQYKPYNYLQLIENQQWASESLWGCFTIVKPRRREMIFLKFTFITNGTIAKGLSVKWPSFQINTYLTALLHPIQQWNDLGWFAQRNKQSRSELQCRSWILRTISRWNRDAQTGRMWKPDPVHLYRYYVNCVVLVREMTSLHESSDKAVVKLTW